MTEAERCLQSAASVLVVDWPSRDVPDTLAAAGYEVLVKGGPGPEDYSVHDMREGRVVVRSLGRPPQRADLVYSHRPLEELPGIVLLAGQVGARAVWCQSGLTEAGTKDPAGCFVPQEASREARALVESAGLSYFEEPYIADAVRRLRP